MDQIDLNYLMHALKETERVGLLMVGQDKLRNGWIVQQIWLDPIYTYCGAGT